MERDYIDQLNQAYDAFFIENQARNVGESVTVLTLDTNELDYVRRIEDLKSVENRIRQTLKQVPFQASLPMMEEL
jgi:deoxyadenosine/deoxycytidine kinase